MGEFEAFCLACACCLTLVLDPETEVWSMKLDPLAVLYLALFTYRELPQILTLFLSVPESIRALLSFRKVDSMILSDSDIAMWFNCEFGN